MPVIPLSRLEQFAAVNLRLDPGAIGGPVHIPSCAQITLVWTQEDGKLAHNVLYGRYAGAFAGSVAQANAIMTGLSSGAAWTALAGQLAPSTALAAVHLRNVDVPNEPIIESTNPAVPGTVSGAPLPNEVAICITLRTAFTGRQFRGRMYLPGFTNAALGAGNTISGQTIDAINAWAATIRSVFSASGYTWVIGQKARAAYTGITGTAHPQRDADSVDITTALVRDNHWDSQRRRGLK
jgi:hypothetical protein